MEACMVPMDGFHYSRKVLDGMSDPELAHARRGAEWTFDSQNFAQILKNIRESSDLVKVPGFDHKKKDPSPGQHLVQPRHKIVLVEGLYVCLDGMKHWKSVTSQFHFRCFLYTSFKTAERRIIPRHVAAGIAQNEDSARKRWIENDSKNADVILESLDSSRLDIKILTIDE
mmetsp:Transcript_10241/g.15306  ORF Transcript_10241/g.15306 Transcript_10241/m.15306 type:complete len:171 (-) Transcript_10241:4-516(-)